jgi:DNA-directed RNA polymerase sigma subunit (sigma70/sigma32)
MHEALQKVRKVSKALEIELERKPGMEEVAARAGITIARLKELYAATSDTSSMDAPTADKGDGGAQRLNRQLR